MKAERDDVVLFPGEIWRPYNLSSHVYGIQVEGLRPGVSPGWPGLEELWTLRPGELTVLTGIPGHGKSTFIDNVMINTARNADWKWTVFSAENYPPERHLAGLAEIYSGKPVRHGPTPPMAGEELISICKGFLDEHLRMLEPTDANRTILHLLELVDLLESDGWDTDGLVIDPWNELEHRRPAGQTETEYVSEVLSRVRNYARTHRVHVLFVAHPTKLQRQQDTNQYPVPTLYDISGSANWRNKADCGLSVWRDVRDDTIPTQIHVSKIRFREVGRIGQTVLHYDGVSERFMDGREQ